MGMTVGLRMVSMLMVLVLVQTIVTCSASSQHKKPLDNSHDDLELTVSTTNTDKLFLDMQATMEAFQYQLERQAEAMARQEQLVQIQRQQIEELQHKVTTHEDTINTHAKQMVVQKRLVKQMSRKLKLALGKLNSGESEKGHFLSAKRNTSNRISRQVVSEGGIAFSAYLNGNLVNIAPGSIIKMSGITLNEGNAYNPSNGIFTTPQDGVYLFSFAMEDYRVHQLRVALVVDGTISSMVATEPMHSGQNLQGTNVVILRLTTGQQVWTEIDQADSPDYIEGSSRWKVTTFSGVFLYP